MEYNRKQTSLEPIDILKFDTVKTGAVFKQYDINTSILELELVANGEPVHLKDEKVYVTVKSSNSLSTQLLSKYSGASVKEKDNYKVLLRAKKSRRRDVNNIIDVYISPLALENSGEMIAEVMIIDLIKEERITSQSFTFEIKPSITPNRPSESAYKLVKDLDGTYITDAEDVQLLVAEVEPNFKLSFVGTRVNEILEKANNFDVEDNTNKIQALQEKDVELESKISNLEKKDSSLDGEIALLKSSDQSIEEEIQGLKTKDESIESEISQLKSKDTAIDGEIDKLKNADETIKSDINSKYEELKQKTDATNNEVMKLKAQDTTLGESIRTNKGLIDVINPKVTTLEQDSQSVKNRVSVLEGDMNLAKSNISSLQSSNTELSQKVEGVEQGNASINEILEQLQSDVERYKSSIELLESKVPVWKDFKGESFKVENSFYGKSRGMIIKGKTLQNLWDIETTDGFYMADLDNGYYVENSKNFACLPNTKYTVIYNEKNQTDNYASVLYKDVNGIHISEGANCRNGQMVTFTTPSNCYYLYTRGFRNTKPHTVTNNGFNFIIIKGELKESVNYFEGIKSFGQQEDKISILSHSKNLCDIRKAYTDYTGFSFVTDTNKLSITGTVNNQWAYVGIPVELSPNIDLTFSFKGKGNNNFLKANIILESNKNNSLTGDISANSPKTFRVNERCTAIIKLFFSGATTGNFNVDYWDIQLEEGTQATTYELYKEDKKDILLQELGFDGGLKDLSEILFDELNSVKNVAIKRIDKHTFTGDENISNDKMTVDETNSTTIGFSILMEKSLTTNANTSILCNSFTTKGVYGLDQEGIYQGWGKVLLRINKSKLETPNVEGFRKWLKVNQTTIYYELAEPVETPLNKDINFDTLDDITYVSLENNIKNELSCQCQVSLASSKA